MRYIISDIHGCYEEYKELLEKINFSDEDELYVLGDVVDRGLEPIKILQDMMNRANVIFLLGNHEIMMYMVLKKMVVEITEDNTDNFLTGEDFFVYDCWMKNGGHVTVEQFRKLNRFEQQDMLDYLEEAFTYEIIHYNEKKYILVHAGLGGFEPDKDLEEYNVIELLEDRADYSRRYYPDENTFLVTGHTPTVYIEGWGKPEVYRENGHIAIDCGCVGGGRLAAFCIETEEVTYVEKR